MKWKTSEIHLKQRDFFTNEEAIMILHNIERL